MYSLLDVIFVLFHSALIVFNLAGWIWHSTRRLHLLTIGITLLSWFGLGVRYGWGYCPCTDWHWQVKRRLGETDLPASYITYYLKRLTGMDWNPEVVDISVVVLGISAFICSLAVNIRDAKRATRGP